MRMAQSRWKMGTALVPEEKLEKEKFCRADATGIGVEVIAAKAMIRN